MPNIITCTRKLTFDAAHRVMRHESKCKDLHGHTYTVEATFHAEKLDTLGRVVDFGEIKEKLGSWIEHNWDHNTVLNKEDQALGDALSVQTGQKVYYMPNNPTAENMARYLVEKICPKLFTDGSLRCTRIRLHETPNCYADCEVA